MNKSIYFTPKSITNYVIMLLVVQLALAIDLTEAAHEQTEQQQQQLEYRKLQKSDPDTNKDMEESKFIKKNQRKHVVEEIYTLEGSKKLRDEYMDQSVKEYKEKNKKQRTWAEFLGLLNNNPNTKDIFLYSCLIFLCTGILIGILCYICFIWYKDREKKRWEQMFPSGDTSRSRTSSMYAQRDFQNHLQSGAARDLSLFNQNSESMQVSGQQQQEKSFRSREQAAFMSLHNRNYDIIHHYHHQEGQTSSVIVDVENGIKIGEDKRNTFCADPSYRSSLNANVFKSNQHTNDSSHANFFGQNGSHINNSASGFGIDFEHQRNSSDPVFQDFKERPTASFPFMQQQSQQNSIRDKVKNLRAQNGQYLELEEDDVNLDVKTDKPEILSPPEIQMSQISPCTTDKNHNTEDLLHQRIREQHESADRYQEDLNKSNNQIDESEISELQGENQKVGAAQNLIDLEDKQQSLDDAHKNEGDDKVSEGTSGSNAKQQEPIYEIVS